MSLQIIDNICQSIINNAHSVLANASEPFKSKEEGVHVRMEHLQIMMNVLGGVDKIVFFNADSENLKISRQMFDSKNLHHQSIEKDQGGEIKDKHP